MATFAEYAQYDGLGLADLVRRKEVSPAELVSSAYAVIERLNPQLNAVICSLEDHAQKTLETGPSKGPFHGVPFLLKDLMVSLAGVPTNCGSRLSDGYTRSYDSDLVTRFKESGVVIIGKTNTPELGMNASTEPVLNGPTHNPWNLALTPGGSSGGSAAAVAAGIVPMAHANDGGGSTRIPATCCHLVGLKPTRGRNPAGPDLGEIWNGFVSEHIVSRSVRDTAAMLDCTAGPSPGDPYFAPPPERPFLNEIGRDPGRLRIAVTDITASGDQVHEDCKVAVADIAKHLCDLGHEVEEAAPAYDQNAFADAFIVIMTAHCTAFMEEVAAVTGRSPSRATLENVNLWVLEHGRRYSALDMVRAMNRLNITCRQVGKFFETYDIFLTPGLAMPPPPLGYMFADNEGLEVWDRMRDFTPFTHIFNATGQPAISVPAMLNSEGLPIGVQLVGRYADDGCLLALASQIEITRPWNGDRPPIFA
ncbi:MAG: amidase [Rhodospirillaceae bacterium]|nr:amidase [Rhodospirillaceae bacterium]